MDPSPAKAQPVYYSSMIENPLPLRLLGIPCPKVEEKMHPKWSIDSQDPKVKLEGGPPQKR